MLSADGGLNAIGLAGFANLGTVNISANVSLTMQGAINNTGKIQLDGGITTAPLPARREYDVEQRRLGVAARRRREHDRLSRARSSTLTNVDNVISGGRPTQRARLVNQADGIVSTKTQFWRLPAWWPIRGPWPSSRRRWGADAIRRYAEHGNTQGVRRRNAEPFPRTVANAGGAIVAGPLSTVKLDTANVSSGSVEVAKNGTLLILNETAAARVRGAFQSRATLSLSLLSSLSLRIAIGVGATLSVNHAISNQGVLDVDGGTLQLVGAMALSGGGSGDAGRQRQPPRSPASAAAADAHQRRPIRSPASATLAAGR